MLAVTPNELSSTKISFRAVTAAAQHLGQQKSHAVANEGCRRCR
jgi:hypothetical protein